MLGDGNILTRDVEARSAQLGKACLHDTTFQSVIEREMAKNPAALMQIDQTAITNWVEEVGGGIVDALKDMKEKAEGELADLRSSENE